MVALIRAAQLTASALLCLVFTAIAAQAGKPFVNSDLAQSANALEAKIKADAGVPDRPLAQLRRDADADFAKNDFRSGMEALSAIVAAMPQDSTAWLRLSRTIMEIRPQSDAERAALLERAGAAAYIAYQRTGPHQSEADSLAQLGRVLGQRQMWRPALDALRLSLAAHEAADVRAQYETLREAYGFRVLDYTIDADTASPRACFQFSEGLPPRADFTPFVALAGTDKPALSVTDKQLCVEGLQHGATYKVTLRAGLPSVVHEPLAKSADFSVYVRDRQPAVRFSTTAYVLPRTGQNGIPLVSVNSRALAVQIYRISERNLIDTMARPGYGRGDFQTGLSRYDMDRLKRSRGLPVWAGEMAIDPAPLNEEVTTAFPVDQALGPRKPGVYVMVARPKERQTRDDDGSLATQWFIVSDLGLTAFSGNDGIHVFVNALASAQPKGGVALRLISRANEVLATRRTDASGQALFERGLTGGEGGAAPALLSAADSQDDYAFLGLRTPAFDLTDRGVGGRPSPHGLDAFVYAERGVYRSGETAHLTALLRDAQGAAAADVPLTFVVQRPDGVEFDRAAVADQGIGGHVLGLALPAAAPSGTWHVQVYVDPKQPPVGATTFMVEDYVPDQVGFDLSSPAVRISPDSPAEVDVAGRFLYGAPAAGLALDGEVTIGAASERAGFPGYQFGLADEEVEAIKQPLEDLPATDAAGKARLSVGLDRLPSSGRPLQAEVAVRMAEPGGRAVARRLTLPVTPRGAMIGVRPLFTGRALADGANARFDVIVLAPDGSAVAQKDLRYELQRVDTHYQFYRRDGRWNFEPVKTTARVADGSVETAPGKPGRINLPVRFGRYRLQVASSDPNGPVTAFDFDAGWYVAANADTPDMLPVALDKPQYNPGDTMTIAVDAAAAGRLTLDVIGDKMLATQSADVKAGPARMRVQVGRDWGTGAYLVATLRRPLDGATRRMPGRAIGVQWFSVDRPAKTLRLALGTAALMRPNSSLRVPVRVDGLAPGEAARIVVAAVDVGVLNLTNYQPPAPDDYYLGQRALAADIRDLYGQLIDGMAGQRGRIRNGGDASAQLTASPPPVGPPVAFYSGVLTVGPDGHAQASFAVPDFQGTLRVMAVAWSKDKVGHAVTEVAVRDPLALTASLPRFLLPGDRSTLRLALDNVEGAPGDYTIAVKATGAVTTGAGATQTLTLPAHRRAGVSVPLSAGAVGNGALAVTVGGPAGLTLARNYRLSVHAPAAILTRRTVRALDAGQSLALSDAMFADLVPGTGSLSVSVGPSSALDAAGLLAALDRYPYRCSEQITSRALPLLYATALAGKTRTAPDAAAARRIGKAVEALLTRQDSTGSFGLWSVGGDDLWLDAYVTDFLTRAREQKFAVPEAAFRLALDRLRNGVADLSDPGRNGGVDLAYALYVLSRNGLAPVGDLRYLADAKLDGLKSPLARAQLAAALALAGDRERAARVYAAAVAALHAADSPDFERLDFGSPLRDAAGVLTLAAEGGAAPAVVHAAAARVEAARAGPGTTSTQEDAWLLLAANATAAQAGTMSVSVGGRTVQRPLFRSLGPAELRTPLAIANSGSGPVQAVVTVTGAPATPEPAAAHGFTIERHAYAMDGAPVDAATVRQNTRLLVVLKVTEAQPQFGRIVVTDGLPAGFEIDNPQLVAAGAAGTPALISNAATPVSTEFRDDRFTAALERKDGDPAIFTLAYAVRAVSPGKYVRPQASVEDMYHPDRYGRTASERVEVTAAQ